MPFESEAQRRYLFSQHPDVARKFVADARAEHRPLIAADLDLDGQRRQYGDALVGGPSFADTLAAQGLQAPPQPGPGAPPAKLILGGVPGMMVPIGGLGGALPPPPPAPAPMFNPNALPPPAAPTAFDPEAAGVTGTLTNKRYESPASDARAALVAAGLTPGQRDASGLSFAKPPGEAGAGAGEAALPRPQVSTIAAHESALVDPKRQAEIAAANATQQNANADLTTAQEHQTEDKAVAAGLKGQQLGAQAEDVKARAAQRDEQLKGYADKMDALSQEVASKKIELHESGWTSTRYALAQALGAFGAALTHGPNYAMQLVKENRDRELQKQRDEIEQKKGRIGDMKGILADTYRRFGNLDQAESAARALSNQQLDAEQQAHAAASDNEALKARSEIISAQLQHDSAQEMAKMNRYVPAQTVQSGGATAADVKRAREILDKAGEAGKGISVAQATQQAMAERLGSGGPGSGLYSKEPNGGKPNEKQNESIQAHEAALENIDKLLKLREKHGGGALPVGKEGLNDRAEAQSLAARTQESLVAALGKTNQGLLDRTSHLVPDQPLEMRLSGVSGADEIGTNLRTAKAMLQSELDRARKSPSAPATPAAQSDGFEPED